MYARITSRCQMKCAHCCMNATAKGQDMTREIFVAACELAEQYGETIFIGGGEPTLHPLLFDFIGIALSHDGNGTGLGSVGLVTNGGVTKVALKLAMMARQGIIACELSQDAWHDPIDPQVVKAFTRSEKQYHSSMDPENHDFRGIRTVKNPYRRGRWKRGEDSCACGDICIEPDGKLFACGCRKLSYGTVFAPKIPGNHQSGECGDKQEPEEDTKECRTESKELVAA